MKCIHCEAELEEGMNFCPACGKATDTEPEVTMEQPEAAEMPAEPVEETTGPEIKEGKLSGGKIALLACLAVAAIAVIILLVMGGMRGGDADTTLPSEEETASADETTEVVIPADGDPASSLCKASYTVSDEEVAAAADSVVATLGDTELTMAELQIHYYTSVYGFLNSYGSYATYLGLDYTLPLDTQLSPDGSSSWQQYFLAASVDSWCTNAALAMEAEANGFVIPDDVAQQIAAIPASLEEQAISYGFESADAMVKEEMGAGASLDDYMKYTEQYYMAMLYYNQEAEKIQVTDADAEAYYDENSEAMIESGIEKNEDTYVDVRHILIQPEGGTTDEETGETTYTDEEWETARVKAQEILDGYLAGEMTEDAFAALAVEHSMDGNAAEGGIYEGVYKGQMLEPFENWCFDASRAYGDTGLVQTQFGYHIMYFVGSEPAWLADTRQTLYDELTRAIMTDAVDKYELTIDYNDVMIGFVDMNTAE